ncbi:hypothetical protein O181_052184 [Austropuccinia psidii MF-1]|uniref:Integrase zinc-binding domain-containing protein n=1 Tax=Austropuccinia psidii MF-1 TaxID=1389203 RepID=A0A9Q3HRE9_9BASI|nr:hypothetical protein [Austropuccinia psidii MF-1]
MTIMYKEGEIHTATNGLSRWPLDNVKRNQANDPEVAAKILIHSMEMDRKKNFIFYKQAPESVTSVTTKANQRRQKLPYWELDSLKFTMNFLLQLLRHITNTKNLEEPCLMDYMDSNSFLIDEILYSREKETSAIKVKERDHISLILKQCHDCPYRGHMGEGRRKEMVASTTWWPQWEKGFSEYINTCERFQKGNRKHGKKYGLLQHIEEPKHPRKTINMDCVTGLVCQNAVCQTSTKVTLAKNAIELVERPIITGKLSITFHHVTVPPGLENCVPKRM